MEEKIDMKGNVEKCNESTELTIKEKISNSKIIKKIAEAKDEIHNKIEEGKKNAKNEHYLNKAFNEDNAIFLNLVYENGKVKKHILFKFDDSKLELYCKDRYNLSDLKYIENPKTGTKYYGVRIINDIYTFTYEINGEKFDVNCYIYKYRIDKPVENKQIINNIGVINQTSIGKNAIVGDGNKIKAEKS